MSAQSPPPPPPRGPHAELGRKPRPIRPMPDTRTHDVLPCVPDSGGLAYFAPTTGEGAMHELRPAARLHGDARPAASPLYDPSGRAASAADIDR